MRLTIPITVAATVLLLAACGEDPQSGATGGDNDQDLSFAFLPGVVANPYFQAEIETMQAIADREGVSLTVIDSNLDADKQVQQLQDVVATGRYDGVLIVPLSGQALVPAVQSAVAAGLSVAALDVPLGPDSTSTETQIDGVTVYSGRPFSKQGDNLGKLTVKACEGLDPCEVAYMYGVKASVYDQVLFDGFNAAIESSSNVEVAAEVEGFYTREGGLAAMQTLIQAKPDLDVLVAVDQSALGAEIAIGAAGLEGQLKIIGFGGARQAIEAVAEGRWFGDSVQVPQTEAKLAIEALIADARGEEAEPYVDPVLEAKAPDDGRVVRDNAALFSAEYDG